MRGKNNLNISEKRGLIIKEKLIIFLKFCSELTL